MKGKTYWQHREKTKTSQGNKCQSHQVPCFISQTHLRAPNLTDTFYVMKASSLDAKGDVVSKITHLNVSVVPAPTLSGVPQ